MLLINVGHFQETASAQFIPTRIYELFNRVSGQGLRISYRFTRSPSVFSNKMCTIELQFENEAKHAFKSISLIDTVNILVYLLLTFVF